MTVPTPRATGGDSSVRIRLSTRREIDNHVERVIRGLGNPEPPLDLREVRELLRLDLAYYSARNDSALREHWSKLIIAGRQVRERPGLLLDAVRKWNLRALYLPDRKRILLDDDVPPRKHRWSEAHEIGHSLLDWHHATMLGDTETALTPSCRAKIEAEANFAAGRLLFLGKRFDNDVRDSALSMAAVQALAKRYGNTITSTLWRIVEEATEPMCAVGTISDHPRYPSARTLAGAAPVRYVFYSPAFLRKFGSVSGDVVWEALQSYCSWATRGPLGQAEYPLASLEGKSWPFTFETFHNNHEALSIGYHLPR